MPSPAVYTNFEIPSSKPRAFPPHPVLPTSKYKKTPQEGLCGKRGKAARKFVTGSLLNLITSYLENRSRVVHSNGSTSEICYTNCGVPQGSVLGPLLFLINVNDISDNIQSSISLFVDDTTSYFSSKFPKHLHLVLSTLGKWSDTWGVSFNAQKTKVLIISSNRGEHLPLIFNSMQLQEVDSHKHLGLLFHNSLSWHPHIISLHQRAMRLVNRLRSISKDRKSVV